MTKTIVTLLATGLLAASFAGQAAAQDNATTGSIKLPVEQVAQQPAPRPVDDAAAAKALRAFLTAQNSMGTATSTTDLSSRR